MLTLVRSCPKLCDVLGYIADVVSYIHRADINLTKPNKIMFCGI